MILKSVLDNLIKVDRDRLMHAFEQHFSQFILLPNDKFIGVNIANNNFQIEEQAGNWSFGTIKKVD